MLLAPVAPITPIASDSPVFIRPIGVLDRVLVESIGDAIGGLTAPGPRTVVFLVRDVVIVRNESLERLLSVLDAFVAAGNRVIVDATPTWRRMMRGRATRFEEASAENRPRPRRQIMICHSHEKAAGAA